MSEFKNEVERVAPSRQWLSDADDVAYRRGVSDTLAAAEAVHEQRMAELRAELNVRETLRSTRSFATELRAENERLRAELNEANEQIQAVQATSAYEVGFEYGTTFALVVADGVRWRAISGPHYSAEFGAQVAVLAQVDTDQEVTGSCGHIQHFDRIVGRQKRRFGLTAGRDPEPCPDDQEATDAPSAD